MREVDITSDELIARLMSVAENEIVCVLDSCGVGHLGSHLLIAGVRPREAFELSELEASDTLRIIDEKLTGEFAAIFTLSYDFGLKIQDVSVRADLEKSTTEPDVFLAVFDVLIVHDYDTKRTYLAGHAEAYNDVFGLLGEATEGAAIDKVPASQTKARSNFTRSEYLSAVERIQEHIRAGDTYQTNLTQQLRCNLADRSSAEMIFHRLRRDHPAPFAAFATRIRSCVVSASPERFFRVVRDGTIETSPIKGTRPRGMTPEEDARLRAELISSDKDRAENTMIVDLMRNDLGRVCEFGSVEVAKLCDVEEHPTLFHLVSTVRGRLRHDLRVSDILRAVFPCGSITGAPKLSTMQIIDESEPTRRGLSMGAIGMYIPPSWNFDPLELDTTLDLSVAIRTMVITDHEAVFNVGGGVVIDSDPKNEFEESLLKAKALLNALGAEFES